MLINHQPDNYGGDNQGQGGEVAQILFHTGAPGARVRVLPPPGRAGARG